MTIKNKVTVLHRKGSDCENSNKLCQHQHVQDRKIFRLCIGQKSLANSFNPDDVVFNFSNRLISDKEKEILSKGLNFAVPPTRLNVCSFLPPFEKFYNLLKQETVNVCSGFFPGSVKARLKDIAYSGFQSYSRSHALFSQEELNTLKDLRNDGSIVTMKPDKGNGVVILNKDEYHKKMDEILADTSKFELLDDDAVKPTLKRENQVKALLKKLSQTIASMQKLTTNCIPLVHVQAYFMDFLRFINLLFHLDPFYPVLITTRTRLQNSSSLSYLHELLCHQRFLLFCSRTSEQWNQYW